MARLTIKDIAELVGVSTATISNYLNGNYNKMSDRTRQQIAEVIGQANYHPSSIARGLAKNENRTIGVSIADITNPFTSQVVSGISEVCNKHDYKVIFTNSDNDPKHEIKNLVRLRSEQVSGYIIDPVNPNGTLFKTFSNENTIMVDRQANEIKVDTIVTDNESSVKEMVSLMKNSGIDEMYFVSWPLDSVSTRIQRFKGFLESMNYPNDDSHLIKVPHHGAPEEYDHFKNTIQEIMANREKKRIGFFSMNGRVFLRLIDAMQSLNYHYPDDYALATYEEFSWIRVFRPRISCIRQDSRLIGITAASNLIDKLENKTEQAPRLITMPTEIRLHESF